MFNTSFIWKERMKEIIGILEFISEEMLGKYSK